MKCALMISTIQGEVQVKENADSTLGVYSPEMETKLQLKYSRINFDESGF